MKYLWEKFEGQKQIQSSTSENYNTISKLAFINLILAFVSLGKDMYLAGYLGTSVQADAFLLAYFIVDALGNNLLASALGVAVLPVLAGLYANGKHRQIVLLTRSIVAYSVVFSTLLAFLMFSNSHGLISLAGAGLSGPSRQLSINLLTILIPSLVGFPLINIGISILQVHNRFIIPALAPILFNAIFLSGLIYLQYFKIPLMSGVYSLAFSIIVGVLLMLALVWLPIIKQKSIISQNIQISNTKESVKLDSLSFNLWTVCKGYVPYLFTILFPQIVYMAERYLASHLEIGSISGLNYAFRLVQFPLWVFVAAVSTVLFPVMAKAFTLGQEDEFKKILIDSIHFTSVLTIPLTIILFVLRVPIVTILLQRGEFGPHSIAITADIMAGYTFTIIWQGFSVIWVRASLISGRIYLALLASAASGAASIGFDFMFVPIMGGVDLGYGAAIGAVVNFVTLLMLFVWFYDLDFLHLWRKQFTILLANLPLFLVTIVFAQVWIRVTEFGAVISKIGYALAVIIVCLPVYWVSLKLFRVKFFEK